MAGAYYIWIMAAIFMGAVFIAALFALVFWIGHRLEKKESGAEHGFLELPREFESRPATTQGLPADTSPVEQSKDPGNPPTAAQNSQ